MWNIGVYVDKGRIFRETCLEPQRCDPWPSIAFSFFPIDDSLVCTRFVGAVSADFHVRQRHRRSSRCHWWRCRQLTDRRRLSCCCRLSCRLLSCCRRLGRVVRLQLGTAYMRALTIKLAYRLAKVCNDFGFYRSDSQQVNQRNALWYVGAKAVPAIRSSAFVFVFQAVGVGVEH